jgi:23S rRNA (uracil1939-C5)-methyltransferase
MSYDAQLESKQRIIRDALTRIGKRDVSEPIVRPSHKQWRYRTKLTLAMRRTRDGSWIAGLHQYDNPGRVFALEDCPITDERVVSEWREILSHANLFPEAKELRGSVRITADGPVFTLIGAPRFPRSQQLFDSVADLAAVWLDDDAGRRRLLHDRPVGNDARTPSASFAQVNEGVASELRAHVVELISSRAPRTVVDAYSGSGETAAALAEKGINVTAIEVDSDAAEFCRARLPRDSQSIQAKVEDVLPTVLPADALILNPPRAGVDDRVTSTLQEIRVSQVVYVSCNPATLARDLSRLPGYRIQSLIGFDMFPQTAHVETVCELVAA